MPRVPDNPDSVNPVCPPARRRPQENDKNITKLRQQYEREVKELGLKYEKKMRLLRDDLELRRKVEILEIEERKVCANSTVVGAG